MCSFRMKKERKYAFNDEKIESLEDKARLLRLKTIEMLWVAGPKRKGHPGGALSAADIVAALYFEVMRIDPAEPLKADRDRFVLSKGHACPVLYGALALRGFFDSEHLNYFRRVGGILQGHPSMKGIPGVDMTTGSLGHGLSAGLGMALATRIDGLNYRVFVMLGDGECQEGLVWEAAMTAAKYKLDNLIAIIDMNKWQACGKVEEILPLEPFVEKWHSFGWNTIQVNGHDMREVLSALYLASVHKGSPTAILAHTIKGKGVSFMEDDNSWHQKAMTKEQYETALTELGADEK